QMSLRHPSRHPARRQARGPGLREVAMTDTNMLPVSRRMLLQGAGAVVVAFGAPAGVFAATEKDARPALVPDELDSYIAVKQDGAAIALFGKTGTVQGV